MSIMSTKGTEKWKRRSSVASTIGSLSQYQYGVTKGEIEPQEGRKPRTLSKALRSLSTSSLDSMSSVPSRSGSSARRLQKTSSGSGSMIERLQRRVSKDSTTSTSPSLTECPGSPLEQPFVAMEILQSGSLKADISLLKARSEYLVLTDHSLVKFGSAESARGVFQQLNQIESQGKATSSPQSMSSKSAATDIKLEVPLRSIVAVFNEEGPGSRFGIEVWWFSKPPRLAYCKAHFYFALPKERNDWLSAIQHAHKARLRKSPVSTTVPENLRIRIHHAIQATEGLVDNSSQNLIFPVARRTAPMPGAEDSQDVMDTTSFYFAIGPCLCYFVEVLRADYSALPGELRIKLSSFGTVTLNRFRASVASWEQRFTMSFRLPFGRETRYELASTHYRRIIEALTKVDRVLKPMWPQNLQHAIFDIKGLPAPLQLTSGNDLGGLETSLQAYCVAFNVEVPSWTIEWNTTSQPAFRLLPSVGPGEYSPLQLLAVFRALRYNSFFKAISLRDVDLTALTGRNDYSQYGDAVVYTSLSGYAISDDHYESLLQAPILEQEIHALIFSSESIRSIDFANVVGLQKIKQTQAGRGSINQTAVRKMSSEIIRPILMLLKAQLCHCHSISMSGNPLASEDVNEIATILSQDDVRIKKLNLATCNLGDDDLNKLWTGLVGQASSLEWLDTSNNHGTVGFELIRHTLAQLRRVKKLIISGNTRLVANEPLFLVSTISNWGLQELDLSGIMLNESTIESLSSYLDSTMSKQLDILRLNNCGLTGCQIARLFFSMGKSRHLTVHLNANQLDEGIDDLCEAIATGYGPWSLFVQMTEFSHETSYVKLMRALTVNQTIECLSLAGCATPNAVSSSACQAASEFFASNNAVRFLDISGYDSKLDEGRLGKEFSKSLSGMRANKRIEHLRVRSQMLNINIGDLAEAISDNTTLHTLDCEGNDFNLSNFWHLVKHMENNTTIRHFSAFSDIDLSRMIQKAVENDIAVAPPRRSSGIFKFRNDKGHIMAEKPLAQRLREEWEAAIDVLHRVLERNQRLYQEQQQAESVRENPLRGLGLSDNADGIFSGAFGGLANTGYESRGISGSLGTTLPPVHSSLTAPDLRNPATMALSENDACDIIRSDSTGSSGAGSSAITEASITSDSGMPTPLDVESPPEENILTDSLTVETSNEAGYNADYSYDDECDGEIAMLIGRYRRFLGDPTSRIEEEDDQQE